MNPPPPTAVADAPAAARSVDPGGGAGAGAVVPSAAAGPMPSPRRLVVAWLVITAIGVVLVLVNLGPLTAARDQRRLLADYRVEIESASNQAYGLAGVEVPDTAPVPGSPVAILDVDALGLRQVVVEGTDPDETRQGPGHVLGTAGPGQPGNSVIVGRCCLYDGPFAALDRLDEGDRIVVSTTQGQTVYEVAHVGDHRIVEAPATEAGSTAATTTTMAVVEVPADGDAESDGDADGEVLPDGDVTIDQLYGPSADDRLTLVTSAAALPWAAGEATVVVATLDGVPFAPTPQGGRTPGDDGRSGEAGVLAPLLLVALAYLAAVAGAVWLHRNVPWRSAYLLTAPLLLALTVVLAEQIAATMPAWW